MTSGYQSNVVSFERGPVKADTDQGFTRLANSMLELLARTDMSTRQFQIVLVVIRRTYGFGQKSSWIAPQIIAEAIGYDGDMDNLRRDVRELVARNILFKTGRNTGPNPDLNQWQTDRKGKWKEVSSDLKTGQHRPEKRSAVTCKKVSSDLNEQTTESTKQVSSDLKTGQHRPPYKEKRKDLVQDLSESDSRKRAPTLDFKPWENLGADPDQIAEWRTMRRQLKKPITPTALKTITREFQKAVDDGRTIDQCLTLCLTKSWVGFKYDWMRNDEKNQSFGKPEPFTPDNSDRSWADGITFDIPDDGLGYPGG